MPSPFYQSAFDSLKLALELFKKGGKAEWRFCIVIADHAVTLIFLDKLSNLNEVVVKHNRVLGFHECIEKLEKKGIIIPEKSGITTVNAERDQIMHKGTDVKKPDARYHLNKVYNFFEALMAKNYKKNIPKSISRYKSSLEEKSTIVKVNQNSMGEFLRPHQGTTQTPIISFVESYNSLMAIINLLGHKRKILAKNTTFNLKNLKKLFKEKIITKSELKKLENVMLVRNSLIHSQQEIETNRYKNLIKFMDNLLVQKLTVLTSQTMAKDYDELGKKKLIDLILSLQKQKSKGGSHK